MGAGDGAGAADHQPGVGDGRGDRGAPPGKPQSCPTGSQAADVTDI